MQILQNTSLKAFNTFGVEAKALYFVQLNAQTEAQMAFDDPRWRNLPRLVLGAGSNILFTQDFPGVIFQPTFRSINELGIQNDAMHFLVEAGHKWHALVQETIQRGYSGLENLSLIPGTVGAAPVQNIGAYGVEVGSYITEVEAIDLDCGKSSTFTNKQCDFSYRHSYFKQHPDRYLIQSITLALPSEPSWNTDYGELSNLLSNTHDLNASKISKAVCQIRKAKLPDPAKLGNAGSFFKNPIVDQPQAKTLKQVFPDLPVFELPNGSAKLSAAWMIDHCGWKGKRRKAIGVSAQHALVLVNYGGGTGKSLWQLAQDIQHSVADTFGIQVEPEPRII